jgi:hypothetical protein
MTNHDLTHDTDGQRNPCLFSAARHHLEQAYRIFEMNLLDGIDMETNLASTEHRRQVDAIKPFLEPADQKSLDRLDKRLERRLREAGALLLTIDGLVQSLNKPKLRRVLNEQDRGAIEQLKVISEKLTRFYFG